MFTNLKVRIGALVAIVALCTAKSCKKTKYLGAFEKCTSKSPDSKGASNFTQKLNSINHLTLNASHSDDPKHSKGKEDGEHPSDAFENALIQSVDSYRSGDEISSASSKSRLEDDEECLDRELTETSNSTDDYTFDYKQEVPELTGIIEAITQHDEYNLITDKGIPIEIHYALSGIHIIRGIYICRVLDDEHATRVFILKCHNIFGSYNLNAFSISGQAIINIGVLGTSMSRDVESAINSRNHRSLHDIIKNYLNVTNNAKITLEYESNFFGA